MLKQNNFFSRNIDITLKPFVRESCDLTVAVSSDKEDHRLAFQGNEAKEAYEEIVKEISDPNLHLERKNSKAKISPATERNTKATKVTKLPSTYEKPKDGLVSKEKVTINTILKAVEQKDVGFLSKHVTEENVNSSDNFGWTPLMSAAYCGHLDIIEFLLNLGANKKAKEKSGLTAAQLALKKNYLNIVALLKKKTDIVSKNTLPELDVKYFKRNTGDVSQQKPDLTQTSGDSVKVRQRKENLKEYSKKDEGFYCDICNANFYETTWKKHETSTLHIFNSKPKLPSTIYGISKQNKGYRMLLNHGWDEQGGLGPTGKGIKYPIKTCLKSDRRGLGQAKEKDYRVTHFKSGDIRAIADIKTSKPKILKKKDRERLLSREARKERALRIALS